MRRKQLSVVSLLLLCSFGFLSVKSAGQGQHADTKGSGAEATTNMQTTHSVEDTVRHQIGGKLHFLDFDPADSITVIGTRYYPRPELEPYREYRFITHNRHSRTYTRFEARHLDSVYKSYLNDESYRRFHEHRLQENRDSVRVWHLDPTIRDFNGYWLPLTQYQGGYYLDDKWGWLYSFCIADNIYSPHYMDGPEPIRIKEATALPGGGITLLLASSESIRIEPFDPEKQIYTYREGDQAPIFITPATAIHHFEIIQYTNSTGDRI